MKGVTDKGLRSLCAPSADPADFESKLEMLSLTNLAGVTDSMLPLVASSLTRSDMVLVMYVEAVLRFQLIQFLDLLVDTTTGTVSGCLCWTFPGRA